MPNCGCSKACSCRVVANGAPIIIESAGDGLNLSLIDVGKVGGPDNIVTGSGRTTDPYSVSWKDSLEYRPRAQEWRQSPFTTQAWTSEPTLYSTPFSNAIFLWALTHEPNLTASGVLLGAYADVNTGGVTTPIELTLFFDALIFDDGPNEVAYSVTSVSNPVLACTGFVNPARSVIDLGSSGLRGEVSVQVRSPANLITAVNQVRVWGVQV